MRILITGGSGLLGRPLAARLAQDGHEIVILSRNPAAHSANLPQGVTAARWDGQSSAGWAHLTDGAGAIVNLAGESIGGGRWTHSRRERILTSRLRAGQAVVEGVEKAQHKPAVLVQASATGYYGDYGDELLAEPAQPRGDIFESRVCIEWEASTLAVEAMGVRRAVIRSGVVFAREGGALPLMVLPFRLFAGGPLGDGRQGLSWIHRDDWVEAVRFILMDERAQGPINVTAPQPVAMEEFGRAAARVLNRPYALPAPSFAIRLVLGEGGDLILRGRKAVPARLDEWGFRFQYPTVVKALRAIYG
jgi:uncharacterized protein (TIGR01777 family)